MYFQPMRSSKISLKSTVFPFADTNVPSASMNPSETSNTVLGVFAIIFAAISAFEGLKCLMKFFRRVIIFLFLDKQRYHKNPITNMLIRDFTHERNTGHEEISSTLYRPTKS
jgi:hypothetical protein